jgi:hypothetical protein
MRIIDLHPFTNFFKALHGLLDDDAFRAAFATLAAMLVVGTVFYTFIEGWNLLDSFYFSVIAASTVGFGDFAPETAPGKIFTVIYVLIGVGLLVLILSRIATDMVERRVELAKRQQPEDDPAQE